MDILMTIQRQPKWALKAGCLVSLAVAGLADYLTADDLSMTAFYLLPLSFAAWFVSRSFGLVLAVAGATTYLANEVFEMSPHRPSVIVLDTFVEGAVFVTLVLLLDALKRHLEGERHARAVAEEALANVRILSSILPMCSSCKKIRDEPDGVWLPFDVYLLQHSETRVSHDVCPDCMATLYPEQFKSLQAKKSRPRP
jgi:hypothetical protein